MAVPALRIENVSKLYRLGEVGTGTLSHDLNRMWARIRGKDDPTKHIGVTNDRTESGTSDFVWALRDINFEVEQGQILGVIGRNGAGKSTLLKILSRVTAPTEGRVCINGRIASLLEVGTGFHPELTGRENIYLNGAILGMTRREINARFDEIVEFSGCGKYIDTPVKRYSSGMHVRLAFAVAAHLETDILIVDEVLAVGDADFQQRCLGKMQELSQKSHRTVLFVSHNMAAVKRLCPRSLLLDKGMISGYSSTSQIIEQYLSGHSVSARELNWGEGDEPKSAEVVFKSISVYGPGRSTSKSLATEDDISINLSYEILESIRNLRVILVVYTSDGLDLFHTSDIHYIENEVRNVGNYQSICCIPGNLLNVGKYYIEVTFDVPRTKLVLKPSFRLEFSISESSFDQTGVTFGPSGEVSSPEGIIHPKLIWSTEIL